MDREGWRAACHELHHCLKEAPPRDEPRHELQRGHLDRGVVLVEAGEDGGAVLRDGFWVFGEEALEGLQAEEFEVRVRLADEVLRTDRVADTGGVGRCG